MRRRIHSIRDEHKEAQILVRQNCFGFRPIDAYARDFVFEGWSENIQRGDAGFEWQSLKFVVSSRVIDFGEIVWPVWKRILNNYLGVINVVSISRGQQNRTKQN